MRCYPFAPLGLAVLILGAGFSLAAGPDSDESKTPPQYSTWKGHISDADTCATAWLLKRFVTPDATFVFREVGEMDLPGIPFGVPQAELRVERGMTTFEAALNAHQLTEPALLMLSRIVRDIELNKWGQKITEESMGLESLLRGAMLHAENNDEAVLETGLVLFDCLYADLKARVAR